MAYIEFTDAAGTAKVYNGKPAPGDRFANWLPLIVPRGDATERASDGLRTMLALRTDYGASFEIRGIPARLTDATDRFGAGFDLIEHANRLIANLLSGGVCQVRTEDTVDATYFVCSLFPGSKPQLVLTDPRSLEYSLSLSVLNLGGINMLCRYR